MRPSHDHQAYTARALRIEEALFRALFKVLGKEPGGRVPPAVVAMALGTLIGQVGDLYASQMDPKLGRKWLDLVIDVATKNLDWRDTLAQARGDD